MLCAPRSSTARLLPLFLSWYLWEVPALIVQRYAEYARAFADIFNFSFILRTLLSPWKGIVDEYPITSLNWELIAQTFFLNLTTRAIGFVFRITAMCFAIFLQMIALAICIACLAFWFGYPAVVLYGIHFMLLAP